MKATPLTDRTALLEALSDFHYVGSGKHSPSSAPPHSMKRRPLPSRFEVGRQYIFHRRNPTDNTEILQVLQNRLRSNGVTVHTAGGSLNRYVGGLAFRVSFEIGEYKGVISNALDGQIVRDEALAREWAFDDYILVFEKVEDSD